MRNPSGWSVTPVVAAALLLAGCETGEPDEPAARSTPTIATPVAPTPESTAEPTAEPRPESTPEPTPEPFEPEVEVYEVPTGSRPHDVAPAADGGVWYTAQNAGELGHLDPETGDTRHVPLGPGSRPHGVIVGPDDAPWLTDGGLNAIVRVDPASDEVARSTTRRLPAAIWDTSTWTPTRSPSLSHRQQGRAHAASGRTRPAGCG